MRMAAATTVYRGRRAWVLRNDVLELIVLQGGGHFARFALHAASRVNPMWTPSWKTVEPWQFRPARAQAWGGSRLLASLSGHLLCLSYFGSPSAADDTI